MKHVRILQEIDPELLDRYLNYQATSQEVGLAMNVNPASVRRAIKRDPRPSVDIAAEKRKLRLIRNAFRASLGHLPIKDIMAQANVKTTTAYKIKEAYARKQIFIPLTPEELARFAPTDPTDPQS